MNDETNNGGPTAPPAPPQAEAKEFDFQNEPWLTMVGIRQRLPNDPPAVYPFPHDLAVAVVSTPLGFIETPQGLRADKTIASVHLGAWLHKNLPAILSLWEVEYGQYMNLVNLTRRSSQPALRLVGADGQRLDS